MDEFTFKPTPIDVDAILDPREAVAASEEDAAATAKIQDAIAAVRLEPTPATVAALADD